MQSGADATLLTCQGMTAGSMTSSQAVREALLSKHLVTFAVLSVMLFCAAHTGTGTVARSGGDDAADSLTVTDVGVNNW